MSPSAETSGNGSATRRVLNTVPSAAAELVANAAAEPWVELLRTAIKDVDELLAVVELERAQLTDAPAIDTDFPLLVPRGFANRMRKRDPRDPLLRQVLPVARERDHVPGFERDPLDEVARSRHGLMRKYAGRALLVATAACPVHCRYCFRRHFPYDAHTASRASWAPALSELAADDDVNEVILSGGDPLTLSNRRLAELIAALERMPQIDILRIHSRFPIVLPERVDEGLLALLAQTRLTTVLIVHCNHSGEIDASVERALAAVRAIGTRLLNQSVLLRGINDDAATLGALSRRLFSVGVLPYYLHRLDRVAGSAHFDVPANTALELVAELRNTLPGYLVPRLARESAGQLSKTVLA